MLSKDVIKVADVLNTNIKGNLTIPTSTQELIIRAFIKWFKSENPKFDEDKFREAIFK